MTDRQYDLMIAYYGSEKNGSQKQARALYDELQGATLWKGKQLNVYFHPTTDPTGSYDTTPSIIQKTPLFLFVVESNPPVDPYGFLVSRDKNGQLRRIYEEIKAEQNSPFYRSNPDHVAKLYVCDGYSMEAAAQLHPIFNGINHFSEEDGALPVLQWAREQLKELEEKGIFPVRAKNGEPQSPTQGGVSEEQFEKMREENAHLQDRLKEIEEEKRKAEEEERRKAEENATLEKSFAFGYYKEGYTVESFFGTETEVVIPSTYKGEPVLKIGESAFSACSNLTSITIPRSVTVIGVGAFAYCSGLTNITIPSSVTTIGESAFAYCSGLESIEIPEGVTSIGTGAFSGCESLVRIKIPYSVTGIGEGAFLWCSSLESITVKADNPCYKSIDGNLYTKGGKVLIRYAIGKKDKSFTIPSSVTTIGERAFSECSNLTSITIPSSVTTIGARAFKNCIGLTNITIPSSVTTIGEWAFGGCSSLESIEIPEGVTTIGEWAFSSCESLTSITIPSSVTTIGKSAFWWCSSLEKMTFQDPNGWFRTEEESDWENRRNGIKTSLKGPKRNAKLFKITYNDCYWYKK